MEETLGRFYGIGVGAFHLGSCATAEHDDNDDTKPVRDTAIPDHDDHERQLRHAFAEHNDHDHRA